MPLRQCSIGQYRPGWAGRIKPNPMIPGNMTCLNERSVVVGSGLAGQRTVKSVPFVELAGGRVQGVVSSGSDIERVYVSFVETGSGDYYCCTNNNRPCGGAPGGSRKHIVEMVDEAILQFGGALGGLVSRSRWRRTGCR